MRLISLQLRHEDFDPEVDQEGRNGFAPSLEPFAGLPLCFFALFLAAQAFIFERCDDILEHRYEALGVDVKELLDEPE